MPNDNRFLNAIGFAEAVRQIHVYGAVLIDLQGIIQSWNVGATELLGYKEEEAVGQHFEFIFTGEDRAAQVPKIEMENALSDNVAFDDRWHVRKNRTRVYVNGGLCLLRNQNGDALGFVKIIRDQTDKKARIDEIGELNTQLATAHESLQNYAGQLAERVAERTRQLHDRNAELEAFCYSIAHDLRAPLRSIQAMSQIMMEDYGATLDATCRDYLGRISRAGQRLDKLTLDLLKYSRLARDEVELGTVSLERAVDEVVASLQKTITARGGEVRVSRPLPEVRAQHSYVTQILANFISNAVKFVDEGVKPLVEIRAEERDGRVRIFVEDNGIGIPDEYKDKVFQLFERLHPDDAYEGTGVGLAIAHKAAMRIEGTIGLEAHSPQGTTFWLELAAAKPEITASSS